MERTEDHTNSSWFASALDSSMDFETESSSSNDDNDVEETASAPSE